MPVYHFPYHSGEYCVFHTGTMSIVTPNDIFKGAYIKRTPNNPEKIPLPPSVMERLQLDRIRFRQLIGPPDNLWFVARIPERIISATPGAPCETKIRPVYFKYYTFSPYSMGHPMA